MLPMTRTEIATRWARMWADGLARAKKAAREPHDLLPQGGGMSDALKHRQRRVERRAAARAVEAERNALAARLAKVEAYWANCAMLRVEPTTAGLTKALSIEKEST